MPDETRHLIFHAPTWGWIGLVASPDGLRLLALPRPTEKAALAALRRRAPDAVAAPDDAVLREAARQVTEFLAGTRREFTVSLDLRGHTPFEQAVWAAVLRIPYGQTRTYTWVADQVGGGRAAAQAAGAAVGANPIPLIIPCHRVIGADGSLHGFAGGLAMKARLLALENGQGQFDLGAEQE
ncbi:MAG: methylated-DNA--[protein]-cysteine S-methyltransferase [Anaerolineae bacterium]|nr:methylated-DNA--[protein]-cysteine S-methyltransferase [Anaerolineae bacterium]